MLNVSASSPDAVGLAAEGRELEVGVHVLMWGQHQLSHAEQGLPHLNIALYPTQAGAPYLPCQGPPHLGSLQVIYKSNR